MDKIKNALKQLSNNKIYIFLMAFTFLATSIYYSLSTSGRLMRDTAESYLGQFNVEDLKLVSSHGIGDEELKLIDENLQPASIDVGYQMDVGIEGTGNLISAESMPESWVKFDLKSGRFPEAPGEIAVDEDLEDFPYELGDTLTLTPKGDNPMMRLKQREFTLVGRISSPEYILQAEKGSSNFTGSTLDGYALMVPEDFDLGKANFARIHLDSTQNLSYFSDQYKAIVDNESYKLEAAFAGMPEKKIEIVKNEATGRIESAKGEIKNLKNQRETRTVQMEEDRNVIRGLRNGYKEKKEIFDERLAKSEDFANNGTKKLEDLNKEVSLLKTNEKELKTQYDAQTTKVDEAYGAFAPIEQEYLALQGSIDASQAAIDSEYNAIAGRLSSISSEITEMRNNLRAGGIRALLGSEEELASLQAERDVLETRLVELEAMEAAMENDRARLGAIEADYYNLQAAYGAQQEILNEYDSSLKDVRSKLEEKSAEKESLDKNIKEANKFLKEDRAPLEEALKTQKKELDEGEITFAQKDEDYNKFMTNSEADIKSLEAIIVRSQEEKDGKVIPTYDIESTGDNAGMSLYSSITSRVDMMTSTYPLALFILCVLTALGLYYRSFIDQNLDISKEKGLNLSENKKKFIRPLAFTLIGLVLGLIAAGLLSLAIFNLYGESFIFSSPKFEVFPLKLLIIILSFLGAFLLAILASYLDFSFSLGQKIEKPSLKNLANHPLRLMGYILGLAASISLLVMGLSLSRSIRDISDIQYNEIVKHHVEIQLPSNVNPKDLGDLDFFITDIKGARDSRDMAVYQGHSVLDGYASVDFELNVPKTIENFDAQRNLIDLEGRKIEIPEEGILISKKMAEVNDLKPGDTIGFTLGGSTRYEASIVNVFENYISDYAYMAPASFKAATGKDPAYNQKNISLVNGDSYAISNFVEEASKYDYVQAINTVQTALKEADNIIRPLNFISLIYIGVGLISIFLTLLLQGVLGTDIRLEEIKGDNEDLISSILGQHFLISILGTILGLGLGTLLFNFITTYTVRDNISIIPETYWFDYALAIIAVIVILAFIYVYKSSQYSSDDEALEEE